jgi:cytochrome P450
LVSTSAETKAQITTRRTDFEKPVETYEVLRIFGESVTTTKGAEWSCHRKVVAPLFSEKNHASVWAQALKQCQSMLDFWASQDGNTTDDSRVEDTEKDAKVLALHVILGAGFGVPQLWPHEDEAVLGTEMLPGFNTSQPVGAHKHVSKNALRRLIGLEMALVGMLPHWILSEFACTSEPSG